MKKFIVGLLIFLISTSSFASGLNASLNGSKLRYTDKSTVVEFVEKVDGLNNKIDISGSNLLLQSADFSTSWTATNVSVTINQINGPDNELNHADLLSPSAADSHIYQDVTASVGDKVTCSFKLTVGINAAPVSLSIHVYDQAHGTILGTEAIVVGRSWKRFWVNGILVTGDTDAGCTIGGGSTWSTGEIIYGDHAQAIVNDEWRKSPGIYHETGTVNKPVQDLAAANSPLRKLSVFQAFDGNKLGAVSYGGVNQDHSVAHNDNFDVFDGNHVMSFLIKQNSTGGSGEIVFAHNTATSGVQIQSIQTTYRAVYYKAGPTSINVDGPAVTINDDMWHSLHIVRDDSTGTPWATVYIDNIAGTPVDISTFGIAGDAILYFPDATWDGETLYGRVDKRALSEDELTKEYQDFLGMGLGSNDPDWTFTRATTAKKEFDVGTASARNPKLVNVASGIPRVTDGVLIEAQVTQVHGLTEQFEFLTTNAGVCTVTPNDAVAPDGTTTADLLDNTGGANTAYRYGDTANLGDLTGKTFTHSVWVRADTPHICTITLEERGVASTTISFNVTTKLQRSHVTRTMVGGGTGILRFRFYPGESGVATGMAHFRYRRCHGRSYVIKKPTCHICTFYWAS